MRRLIPLLAATSLLAAAEPGYDLHEWGVFTTCPGNPFAQQDYKEEWASFPAFFTKQSPVGGATRNPLRGGGGLAQPPVSMPAPIPPVTEDPAPAPARPLEHRIIVRKPVVFLEADDDMLVDLAFTLRGGKPLVWWPNAEATGEVLRFALQLWDQEKPRNGGPVLIPPPVPAGHWIEHLRAAGGDFVRPLPPEQPGLAQRPGDTFIYYDGLIPAPAAPRVEVLGSDKNLILAVTNPATFSLLDALLLWRAGDGTLQVSGWVPAIGPGARVEIPLLRPAPGGTLRATLGGPLSERLVAAGLTRPEAEALVDTWHQELFQHQGLTLLYRVPQATYDALLPLTATPAPRHRVRVGLMVHEHLEPSLTADVNALIDRLANAAEADRPALMDQLEAYGGAAFPVMRARLAANDPESAVCRHLLAELDLAAP